MPDAIELTSQDVGVLLDALDYCEKGLPQVYEEAELDALRDHEGEPAPIIIVGDSARTALGALMLLSEERTEKGNLAKDVLTGFQKAINKRSKSGTPA
ncbi:MAG: hypothetical protein QG628_178 [Patescibacteria group bacterium]|nr:hypothetical protein [Patescibacteria group bacterium]